MFRSILALALGAAMLSVPLAASAEVTPAAQKAVLTALDDEYHAEATYQAVIAKFGAVRPFTNILKAEQRHQAALIAILEANNLPVPPNPYTNGTKTLAPVPATLAEACEVGVKAEIANASLYDDDLLPAVAGDAQITRVMTSLRDASQTKHLPAFQRCAAR